MLQRAILGHSTNQICSMFELLFQISIQYFYLFIHINRRVRTFTRPSFAEMDSKVLEFLLILPTFSPHDKATLTILSGISLYHRLLSTLPTVQHQIFSKHTLEKASKLRCSISRIYVALTLYIEVVSECPTCVCIKHQHL